jgi:diadenylate cyclase
MLIQIGQAGAFLTSHSHHLSKTIEEIIQAVVSLSANKTGAIIVIEKQVALGEFIETGVRIDAQVKAALLETIFYPGSPLHDLAVIIRGQQVVAARVQMPLAELGSVGGALGSRHRAAIGISSATDAAAIVVSEETGIISVAQSGNLERHLTEEQLREKLTNIMTGNGKNNKNNLIRLDGSSKEV